MKRFKAFFTITNALLVLVLSFLALGMFFSSQVFSVFVSELEFVFSSPFQVTITYLPFFGEVVVGSLMRSIFYLVFVFISVVFVVNYLVKRDRGSFILLSFFILSLLVIYSLPLSRYPPASFLLSLLEVEAAFFSEMTLMFIVVIFGLVFVYLLLVIEEESQRFYERGASEEEVIKYALVGAGTNLFFSLASALILLLIYLAMNSSLMDALFSLKSDVAYFVAIALFVSSITIFYIYLNWVIQQNES